MTCWIPFCVDCTAKLCDCGRCHTDNCDGRELCLKQKQYIKGYNVLKYDKRTPT